MERQEAMESQQVMGSQEVMHQQEEGEEEEEIDVIFESLVADTEDEGETSSIESEAEDVESYPEDAGFFDGYPDVEGDAVIEMVTEELGRGVWQMGRRTTWIETRDEHSRPVYERPKVRPGTLWVDPDFPQDVALANVSYQCQWKRPGEFCQRPCLFSEGITRFDIGQGGVGTCWFLSIVASLAEQREDIMQAVPADSYMIGSDAYDGVFHCRFWRFGHWVDVYIDDYLPVTSWGALWGAKNADDPNELWVALLEKAFAKFHGGYKKASSGWTGDAFIDLTGGLAERVDTAKVKPMDYYQRIKNALSSGATLACSLSDDKDGVKGLVGNHAYSLTGAAQIPYRGKQVPMIRVRNPWGKEKGEWQGAWSDNSSEWKHVASSVKNKLEVEHKGDGEFWMTLTDFRDFFESTTICHFSPDFNQDGTKDELDNVTVIFGEWKGATAAGRYRKDRLKNPKYIITVPETEGGTPVVIQLIQEKKHRRDQNIFYLKADLSKVVHMTEGKEASCILKRLTENATYMGGDSITDRHRLDGGRYLIVPATYEAGNEKSFCLRVFSAREIPAREMKTMPNVFNNSTQAFFEHSGRKYITDTTVYINGSWKKGVNAGGQISHRHTHATNPQYLVTIAGNDAQPVTISLMQETSGSLAVGFSLYPVDRNSVNPLSYRDVCNKYDRRPSPVSGRGVFTNAKEGKADYLLSPGNYVMLVFTDRPGEEGDFMIGLSSRHKLHYRLLNSA